MSDDKTLRNSQDSSRVNINEDYEVRYWTKKFSCTKEQLEKAVKSVGVSASKIEEFLKGK